MGPAWNRSIRAVNIQNLLLNYGETYFLFEVYEDASGDTMAKKEYVRRCLITGQ